MRQKTQAAANQAYLQSLQWLDYTGEMKTKLALILMNLLLCAGSFAQALSEGPSYLGAWEGAMMMGREDMKLALTITEENGQLHASLISAELGIYGMPADKFSIEGTQLKAVFSRLGAEFTGKLRLTEVGDSVLRIDGDWFQSAEMIPITLLPVAQPSF